MTSVRITLREFARREKCDEALVRRRQKAGHLPKGADGKIDAALVGTGWCARNARRADSGGADKRKSVSAVRSPQAKASKDRAESPAAAAKRLVYSEGRVFETKAEAERHKESFLARLRELQFDRESGKVVEVDAVAAIVTGDYLRVKGRLLPIGALAAPRLVVAKSADECKAIVDELVHQALAELSAGEDIARTVGGGRQ